MAAALFLLAIAAAGPRATAQMPPPPGAAGADAPMEEAEPAAAPDGYQSPADTLATFLRLMQRVEEQPDDQTAWRRIFAAMQQPESLGESRKDIALTMRGVLAGIGPLRPAEVAPGEEAVREENLERFLLVPDSPDAEARAFAARAIRELGPPPARIVLVRTDSGWKFSERTLDAANQLWVWIEPLAMRNGVDLGALSPSARLRVLVPDVLKNRFFLTLELWQWAGLAALILLAILADLLARLILSPLVRRITRRYLGEPDEEGVRHTVRPLALAVAALVFLALVRLLGVTGTALSILLVAGKVVLIVGLAWAAWALSDMLSHVYGRRAAAAGSAHAVAVPLVRRTVKLVIFLFALVYILAAFDVQLLALLGGLGLAGLAISFAAQGTVANLFGGLNIFLDRPYKVGERIKYKGYDGVVEEIGFRITRLRTLEGHLVTIPNSGVTSEPVENVGRRPYIRRIMNVTITYDTPREKIERAVRIIRDILEEPGLAEAVHGSVNGSEMPPMVFFSEFNADSLNIFVIYWHFPPAWGDYMAHAERLNFRIFEEYEKAGIEFAFPTQTLYLAGDPKRELALKLLREHEAGWTGNGPPPR